MNKAIVVSLCLVRATGVAQAQELQPHKAAYEVAVLEHGKPSASRSGNYAFELRVSCEEYVINQRLRVEVEGGRGALVSEQQSQMTESRDGRRLTFEHRSTANGRTTSLMKGEATLDQNGRGEARFSEPAGQSVALPAETMFPMAITRATIRHGKAGDAGFDALFFFGDKVKPPQAVNVVMGRVPKRLSDLEIPPAARPLVEGRARFYYRGGFFDAAAKAKGDEAAFEMSSLVLDNGIELYGTHEEHDGGIQYKVSRLESLPKPSCN